MDTRPIALQILSLAVFATVFTIGLRTHPADALYLVRRWDKGLKAMAALYLIAPALAILLSLALAMPREAKVALLALSVSPTASTMPDPLAKLGGERRYSVSVGVVGAAASLAVAPMLFWLVSRIAEVDISIRMGPFLLSLAKELFVPLGLGILLNLLFPGAVSRVADAVSAAVALVLTGSLLVVLWILRHFIMAQLDWRTVLSLLVLVCGCIAGGHLLGGPKRGDKIALALSAASRNAGYAIALGTLVLPNSLASVGGVVLMWLIVQMLAIAPYKRAVQQPAA